MSVCSRRRCCHLSTSSSRSTNGRGPMRSANNNTTNTTTNKMSLTSSRKASNWLSSSSWWSSFSCLAERQSSEMIGKSFNFLSRPTHAGHRWYPARSCSSFEPPTSHRRRLTVRPNKKKKVRAISPLLKIRQRKDQNREERNSKQSEWSHGPRPNSVKSSLSIQMASYWHWLSSSWRARWLPVVLDWKHPVSSTTDGQRQQQLHGQNQRRHEYREYREYRWYRGYREYREQAVPVRGGVWPQHSIPLLVALIFIVSDFLVLDALVFHLVESSPVSLLPSPLIRSSPVSVATAATVLSRPPCVRPSSTHQRGVQLIHDVPNTLRHASFASTSASGTLIFIWILDSALLCCAVICRLIRTSSTWLRPIKNGQHGDRTQSRPRSSSRSSVSNTFNILVVNNIGANFKLANLDDGSCDGSGDSRCGGDGRDDNARNRTKIGRHFYLGRFRRTRKWDVTWHGWLRRLRPCKANGPTNQSVRSFTDQRPPICLGRICAFSRWNIKAKYPKESQNKTIVYENDKQQAECNEAHLGDDQMFKVQERLMVDNKVSTTLSSPSLIVTRSQKNGCWPMGRVEDVVSSTTSCAIATVSRGRVIVSRSTSSVLSSTCLVLMLLLGSFSSIVVSSSSVPAVHGPAASSLWPSSSPSSSSSSSSQQGSDRYPTSDSLNPWLVADGGLILRAVTGGHSAANSSPLNWIRPNPGSCTPQPAIPACPSDRYCRLPETSASLAVNGRPFASQSAEPSGSSSRSSGSAGSTATAAGGSRSRSSAGSSNAVVPENEGGTRRLNGRASVGQSGGGLKDASSEAKSSQCLPYLQSTSSNGERNGSGGSGGSPSSAECICGHVDGAKRIDTLRKYHLHHCYHYSLWHVLSDTMREGIVMSRPQCYAYIDAIERLDNLAAHFVCQFEDIIQRYDCGQTFSSKSSCHQCKVSFNNHFILFHLFMCCFVMILCSSLSHLVTWSFFNFGLLATLVGLNLGMFCSRKKVVRPKWDMFDYLFNSVQRIDNEVSVQVITD